MGRSNCLFCELVSPEQNILFDGEFWYIRFDNFPVNEGHVNIVTKRHVRSMFELSGDEWSELPAVLAQAKTSLDAEYHPQGYNLGVNDGSAAGQTLMHAHIHLIPRYDGDVEHPRGGICNFKPALKAH